MPDVYTYRFACACGNYDEIVVAEEEPGSMTCTACGQVLEIAIESTESPPWVEEPPEEASAW